MSIPLALPAGLAARADTVAALIRERLGTPEQAEAAAVRAARQTDMSFWAGPSLSEGHAGLALLHTHAARSAQQGDSAEREQGIARGLTFVRAAFSATADRPLRHPGLFDGTAGLSFALRDVSRDEPRLLPSLDRLHEQLARQVLAAEWPEPPQSVADHHYDLVYGAAGILYELCSAPAPTPVVERSLTHCLTYLVRIAGHWRSAMGGDRLDTGMSHGAAGIAASLASAWRRGHRVPGQRAAIDELTEWLLAVGRAGGRCRQWSRTGRADDLEAAPAWCHGTGGVAAALLTVARSTGDRALGAEAFAALDGLLDRVAAGDAPRSATVCHGLAGLVVLAHEFAVLGSEGAARALPGLALRLVDAADPELPLVYRDHETTGHVVDNPGLLTGAAGVALTLRALATGHRPGWWDALFPGLR